MRSRNKFIFLAVPWAPVGGGMYRVMDYMMQAQRRTPGAPDMRVLDSRGGGHVALSFLVLFIAVLRLVWGILVGRVAGLHVNMAERMSVFRKGVLVLIAHWMGIPVVLHLHAAQMEQFYAGQNSIVHRLIKYVFSQADVVVVLGERARRFVIEQLEVPAARVEMLINGVPGPCHATPRPVAAVPHLFFLGNLLERKGVSDLLAALATPALASRKWRATFAGGGKVDAFVSKAAAMGLSERVSFSGWATQQQASDLLSTADVLMLPSYDEGLPLVILEALGQAVPVICTPVGEIPQVLVHRETAFFVEPGNVDQLVSAICTLLDDEEFRLALGASGRRLYEQALSMDVFFGNLMRIYRRCFDPALFADVNSEVRPDARS